ncbi:MAG: DUF2225 domain-containing protein [Lachnospiraceae bacterium]|nr:DUF2225 domain-containing protein [Lachnospiraceae bacterium]
MSSNLFSGLEKVGLFGMSNVDIFDTEEKKNNSNDDKKDDVKVHEISEEELLYDKSYKCPVCDWEFKTKAVRTGKARMISVDSDLRPKYQGIDTIKYDAIVCNKCGYAALSRYFNYMTLPQAKLIINNISSNFKGLNDKLSKYSYEDALIRHRLALVNAVVKKSRISERAYICLKIAWLLRGQAENLPKDTENYDEVIKNIQAEEQDSIEKAYEGFKSAMSKEVFPICGMDESTYLYVTADLARRCKDYTVAYKLVGEVITSRAAGAKIKDRARELKELLKKEREELV